MKFLRVTVGKSAHYAVCVALPLSLGFCSLHAANVAEACWQSRFGMMHSSFYVVKCKFHVVVCKFHVVKLTFHDVK